MERSEDQIIVKVSAGRKDQAQLFSRQTPTSSAIWNGVKFVINEYVDRCDWWFVCHSGGLIEEEIALCDPRHVVLISMEPPVWGCPHEFYNQFSHLVTCDRETGHPSVTFVNGITWWVGLKVKFENGHQISSDFSYDYDSLMALPRPAKVNRISIITSQKSYFPGHQKRLKFLEKLSKNEISNHIDIYGGNHNPVEDKMEALIRYKYHLALENSVTLDYWTEKFADPILAWCLPIYYGCPNIDDYFPPASYFSIQLDNFDDTVRKLWSLLESDHYVKCIPDIGIARDLVLNKYNIFQLMTNICKSPSINDKPCALRPISFFSNRAKRLDRRITMKAMKLIQKLSSKF